MNHTILLIEDDGWLAELYKDILETAAHTVVITVPSAEAALNVLNDESTIDLILLDMILPSHNGIEFLHEIASYTDLNTIPVIVLSSVYQHEFTLSSERWKHYGVVSYLYKPQTKPQDLLAVVKKQFALQESVKV